MHIIPWVYDATWCNLECWKVHVKSPPRMIACNFTHRETWETCVVAKFNCEGLLLP